MAEGRRGARRPRSRRRPRLLERTARLAEQCAVDVREDLGIGSVRYPELDVVTTAAERGLGPSRVLQTDARREWVAAGRAVGAVRQRLDEELAVIDSLGYPSYFLTVADVVDLIKSLRVRAAARPRPAAWSPTCWASPTSTRCGTAC